MNGLKIKDLITIGVFTALYFMVLKYPLGSNLLNGYFCAKR